MLHAHNLATHGGWFHHPPATRAKMRSSHSPLAPTSVGENFGLYHLFNYTFYLNYDVYHFYNII